MSARPFIRWANESASRRSITADANVIAFRLQDVLRGVTAYSGLVIVNARSADSTNSRAGSYALHVAKSEATGSIALISALGRTAGAAASDPSFTVAID